jgi:hypothetical protein
VFPRPFSSTFWPRVVSGARWDRPGDAVVFEFGSPSSSKLGHGVVSLEEALLLFVLVAELQLERLNADARCWLARLATERSLMLAELDRAITALRAFPSDRAAAALRGLLSSAC